MSEKNVNRRISLKELFSVVTYFAFAAGFIQIASTGLVRHDASVLLGLAGAVMLAAGIGGASGFAIGGRQGVTIGVAVMVVLFFALVVVASALQGGVGQNCDGAV